MVGVLAESCLVAMEAARMKYSFLVEDIEHMSQVVTADE